MGTSKMISYEIFLAFLCFKQIEELIQEWEDHDSCAAVSSTAFFCVVDINGTYSPRPAAVIFAGGIP